MKNRLMIGNLIFGGLYVVLGNLITTGSNWLFEVCDPARPMICNRLVLALIGVGAAIILIGILIMLLKDKSLSAGLSIGAGLFGILTILFPTKLIGICMVSTMPCRSTNSKLFWCLFGAAVVIVSLINLLIFIINNRKDKPKYDTSSFENS